MKADRFVAVIVAVFLLSVLSVIAEYDLGPAAPYYSCDSDADEDECPSKCEGDDIISECYCNSETNSCWVAEEGDASKEDADSDLSPQPNAKVPPILPVSKLTANVTTQNRTILSPSDADVAALKAKVASLEQQQAGTVAASSNVNQRLSTLEGDVSGVKSDVSQLQANMQNLLTQQGNTKKEVSTVATGLAGLQKTADETESDLKEVEKKVDKTISSTQWLKYGVWFLILVVAGLGIGVYMTKGKGASVSADAGTDRSSARPSQDIISFITKNIKKGKKYPEIKQSLLRAGWSEEDINSAYKETTNRNYQQYLQKSGSGVGADTSAAFSPTSNGKPPKHHTVYHRMDKQKVMYLAAFAVLIIVGMIFLLKGVTTGKAIHFQSPQQFKEAVAESLATNLENNEFYPLVRSGNLCVQVKDDEQSQSFRIIKTPRGHAILSLEDQCDYSDKYDFAVKFTSWESFDLLSNGLTCVNAQLLHVRKGLYILPSQFVQEGFQKADKDYAPFCDALKLCLTEDKLPDIGC